MYMLYTHVALLSTEYINKVNWGNWLFLLEQMKWKKNVYKNKRYTSIYNITSSPNNPTRGI